MNAYIATYLFLGVTTGALAWVAFVRGEGRGGTFGDVLAFVLFAMLWPLVWLLEIALTAKAAFRWAVGPCWWTHQGIITIQEFGTQARRIGCLACGKSFYVHDGQMLITKWTKGHTELYRDTLGFTMVPWKGDKNNEGG